MVSNPNNARRLAFAEAQRAAAARDARVEHRLQDARLLKSFAQLRQSLDKDAPTR